MLDPLVPVNASLFMDIKPRLTLLLRAKVSLYFVDRIALEVEEF